jgi:hypothetical protein
MLAAFTFVLPRSPISLPSKPIIRLTIRIVPVKRVWPVLSSLYRLRLLTFTKRDNFLPASLVRLFCSQRPRRTPAYSGGRCYPLDVRRLKGWSALVNAVGLPVTRYTSREQPVRGTLLHVCL